MGRTLLLWEMDMTRVPASPQERGAGWSALLGLVKQDMEKGVIKDWGSFFGETRGFAIGEGTELEVATALQKYVPFVKFEFHPIASVSQNEEILKALIS